MGPTSLENSLAQARDQASSTKHTKQEHQATSTKRTKQEDLAIAMDTLSAHQDTRSHFPRQSNKSGWIKNKNLESKDFDNFQYCRLWWNAQTQMVSVALNNQQSKEFNYLRVLLKY